MPRSCAGAPSSAEHPIHRGRRIRRRRHGATQNQIASPRPLRRRRVITRLWSCASPPARRMPGTRGASRSPNARPHRRRPRPRCRRSRAAPAVRRQPRQPQHLALRLQRVGTAPRSAEHRGVEGRQHRHRQDAAAPSGIARRLPRQRAASARPRTHAPSGDAPRAGRAPHAAGHGVRDVVELEVEEDVGAQLVAQLPHDRRPAAVNSSLPTL